MSGNGANSMVIGIAGGVGSGKSTVLGILEQDFPVRICMADELGHMAMEQGTDAYAAIVREFGNDILCEDGEINRVRLAEIVYRKKECLATLNGIIHPFVKNEIRKQIGQCPKEQIFVLETAILFETGCDALCDEVWGIITDGEIRIRRLMQSRGYSREKAEQIMENQMGSRELAARCDRVIRNDGDREQLRHDIHISANEVVAILQKV